MNFDEAIGRAETIIAQLEQAQARLAGEATALLKQCKAEIDGMEQNFTNI